VSNSRSIYVGYDPRETNNFVVCLRSARSMMKREDIPVHGLVLDQVRRRGLYTRPTSINMEGKLWDKISDAPMSTEFACSRFLVPHLQKEGLALFVDCDTMFLSDPAELFDLVDPSKAVTCVKHNHVPTEEKKKTGEIQTKYNRKNWSSVMVFNCEHPANQKLTVEMINTLPGRDLHAFCWLEDDDIGALPATWNHLVGVTMMPTEHINLVHWTLGSPNIVARENTIYYDEFHHILNSWAISGGALV